MTPAKRVLDLALVALICLPGLPVLAGCILALRIAGGGGVFYGSVRVGQDGRPFTLWKLRTMAPGSDADGGVSGGAKAGRITPLGRHLRRWRLDELPQLWNILKGEMSFVGPRPPLPRYVERFPHVYADVLRARPGITGLATCLYHRREEALLAACTSAEETDAVYSRRCVPAKARLDRIYLRRASPAFDLWLIGRTAAILIAGRGRGQQRRRAA
ncbi:MAG: sugar transferase [Rhodobacteraceae bacterium]|jgi:lipopolysaccharide/colanic/teichoic acid biosynthesis glycosyltransferase|nr:sugar transferase [Paracoccaceae bacterium]